MTTQPLSLDELQEELVAELMRLRHSTSEGSVEEFFISETNMFVKTWGNANSAFIRRSDIPQMQTMQFFVNGQPMNMKAHNDDKGDTKE